MGRHAYKVPFDAGKKEIRSMNYFEQQHCLSSQEACTLATTPKKVGMDPRFTPASSEVQQRKHEAEQDNWFCKPESTAYIQKWCAYIEMRARWLPTEQQVSGPSSTAAESSFSLDPKLESTSNDRHQPFCTVP